MTGNLCTRRCYLWWFVCTSYIRQIGAQKEGKYKAGGELDEVRRRGVLKRDMVAMGEICVANYIYHLIRC